MIFFIPGLFLLWMLLPSCNNESDPPDDPLPFIRLLKDQVYYSQLLRRDMSYAVLLPEDYDSTGGSYPVVYLLHGYGDDEKAWYQGGNIQYYADLYLAETGPMIFVMPEAFNTYYVNKYNGNYPIMDVLVTELIPAIDSLFRTKPDPQHRAVMGYSMGGYGAIILPAKNPEVFRTGVSLSMSFRTDSQYVAEPQDVFDYQWGPVFGGIGAAGEERLTGYFLEYSPFHFFADPANHFLWDQNFYFACGDEEETLDVTNEEFHNFLQGLGFPHTYLTGSGGHSWSYWHRELPFALEFISVAFQQDQEQIKKTEP